MGSRLAKVRRALQKRFQPFSGSGFLQQPTAPGIDDGVRYTLPILMPEQLRDVLIASGQMDAYLAENAGLSFRFQFDTPQRSAADNPFLPPVEDPLREWNWSTREYVLTNTHAAYQRNPIANRACKYIASFVIGKGFMLSCKNEAVERVLQAFIDNEDNDIRTYERQAIIDLLVDGELMLRLYSGDGDTAGQLVAVPQRPWECRWIETEPGFFRRRVAYCFQRRIERGDMPTGGITQPEERVPASNMLHVAINRHGYELRGRPELFAVLPWLRAYKEWLENRARQNHWRTSFMWLVRVRTTAAEAVAAVAARWRRTPTPGSVAVESDAVSVEPLTNPIAAGDASEDGRQIKLMNAVGFGLPEYMLSDGSNANLASSTSQQLPALMTFADFQRVMLEELWRPLFRRVIQAAVDAGDLPDIVAEMDADGDPVLEPDGRPCLCKAVDAFAVAYAPLSDANVQALATALEIAARNGWVDAETATTELGFDYAQVQKRLKRDQQNDAADIAQGIRPAPVGYTPPGMMNAVQPTPDQRADQLPAA